MTMQSVVTTALPVYRRYSSLDDNALIEAMGYAGMEQVTAVRVVEFMPLAFVRVLLDGSGAQLPDTYVRMRADGTPGPEQPLMSEPVYAAALELARSGVSQEDMMVVAGRSAELHALNQALNAGSQIGDLVFAPPHLLGAEDGSAPAAPRKPWWKFW